MIFVTVGMHTQGFERLIQKMDVIAGKINEPVIMQIGYSKYFPRNATFFNFIEDENKMISFFKEARIIVCHAGAGTLITAMCLGKNIIVVPRLKRFKEHNDDEQLDLTQFLSSQGKITPIYDIDDLEGALKGSLKTYAPVKKSKLVNYLKNAIK